MSRFRTPGGRFAMPPIVPTPPIVPVEPRVPAADLVEMAKAAKLEAELFEGLAYGRVPRELTWSWLTTARSVAVMAARIGEKPWHGHR